MFPRKPYRHINLAAARELMSREAVVVIDVRDVKAYNKSRLPGAKHVTIANLSNMLNSIEKDTPVLIYCYRGYASQEYAQTFSDFRFQEVYSLDGGYDAWRAEEEAQQAGPAPQNPQKTEPLQAAPLKELALG